MFILHAIQAEFGESLLLEFGTAADEVHSCRRVAR